MIFAKDTVEVITNVVVALAAILGLGIAWAGLRTWKAQLRGTSRHEVARRILGALQSLGDAIELARHNLAVIAAVRRGASFLGGGPPEELQRVNPQQAAQRFGQLVWKALERLRAAEVDAVAVMGREAREQLVPVFTIVGFFTRAFSAEWDEHVSPEVGEEHRRTAEKWGRQPNILYATSEKDEYSEQLGDALKSAEDHFRRHL